MLPLTSSAPSASAEGSVLRRLGQRFFALAFAAFAVWPAALLSAAPINLLQDPAGSGLFTALVNDELTAVGVANADEWSFEGEAGDRLTVRVEAAVGASRPKIRLLNTMDNVLATIDGGADGVGALYAFVIPTPGTYRVRLYTDHSASAYAVRVDLARGLGLEVENNNDVASANVLVPTVGAGSFAFKVAGSAPADDLADTFALGLAPSASSLQVSVQLPSSTLTSDDVALRLFERRTTDRALDFNGSTFATIPHHAVFDAIETANTFTMEAWVFIRSWPQSYFPIFDKYRSTGDTGWAFAIQNGSGGLSLFNGAARASSDVTPTINTWHHVAVAYDHGANSVRFYIDGALVATRASVGTLLDTDGDPAYLGYSPAGGNEFSNGLISEVRLWNRALTTAEIEANYVAANVASNEAGLVGLWRFDEGSGNSASDASPSAQPAVLGGGDPARVPAWSAGTIRPVQAATGTSLSRTFAQESHVWVELSAAANRGLSARYLLNGSLTDSASLQVISTSLPSAGGSTTAYLQGFSITFDDELNAASANDLSNIDFRGAGPDAAFGTADDIVYTFVPPNYTNGAVLTLALANGPLQEGAHRLTLGLGLRDRAGNSLANTYTTDFTSERLGLHRVENQGNNTFATATNLPLVPEGAGYVTGGRGNLSDASDTDYFSFTATAGDRIIINSSHPVPADYTGLYYRVYASNQAEVMSFTAFTGISQGELIAPSTGTYYVKVNYNYAYNGEYRFIVAGRPGSFALESEGNNTAANADALTWTNNAGTRTAAIGGLMNAGDPSDWYALGFVDAGTVVQVTFSKTEFSSLSWTLEVMDASGNAVLSGALDAASVSYTVPSGKAGNHYVRLRPSSGADMLAQYLLNVSVGDSQGATIVADTLPIEGSTVNNFYGEFQLNFSENLQAASVNDSANYDLRSAGEDDTFDTADDQVYTVDLQTDYTTGFSAKYYISDGALQPGRYRLEVGPGLIDAYGNPMAGVFSRTFTLAGVAGFVLESRNNNSFATATSLMPLTADGPGWLVKARGNVTARSDVDFYSFTATANDRILVTTENLERLDYTGQSFQLYGPNQAHLTTVNTFNGSGQLEYIAPTTGTYYVRVAGHYTYYNEYRFAVAVVPGAFGFESESNNAAGSANALTWTSTAGGRTSQIMGALVYSDPSDWFALGFLDVGTEVTLAATKPASSALVWILEVLNSASVVVASVEAGASTLTYTVPADKAGTHYARLRPASGSDLLAQYTLTLTLSDVSKPSVVSVTLPAEGSTVTDFFGDFQVNFSETLQASTVNSLVNFDLRAAGTDGLFDTGDDELYTLALISTYTNALNARFRVTDGPLQPGLYRFQAKTGLLDLYGNAPAAVYSRTFTMVGVEGYVFESRSNNTFATATTLGTLTPDGDGAIGKARGTLTASGDVDYFSFTANVDDRVIVSTENVPNADYTGLSYTVYGPTQASVSVVNTFTGTGQISFVATLAGTYYVKVTHHYTYLGEYRLAVAVVPGAYGFESEGNNSAAAANVPAWSQTTGYQSATLLGLLNYGDPADWFALGSLSAGTNVNLTATKPLTNSLSWVLEVLNGASVVVGTSATNAASFTFEVPAGDAARYYARLRPISGADLLGFYKLGIALTDSNAPAVTADTLPAEGSTSTQLFDRFTLTFSEDMEASSVNDVAHYDLVEAGTDGVFDTADDVEIPLILVSPYTSGLNVSLRTANSGTLGAGSYRFLALPGLRDKTANALSPVHERLFTIAPLPGYVYELEANNTRATATVLPLASTQANLFGAGARGNLFNNSDIDFWSVELQAGDRVYIAGENPGSPSDSALTYQLFNPAGTSLTTVVTPNNGQVSIPLFTAATAGAHAVRISISNGYHGEYRFRLYVARGDLQIEAEPNNTLATATALVLSADGDSKAGALAGVSRVAGDLDYFNLGSIQAGTTIFLSTRQPANSTFVPVVSLYASNGALLTEAAGGRSDDGVAQVNLTATGTYYALVRTSGATSGLDSEYVLDALAVPTQGTTFPNLQVTSLTPPPATGLKSGDSTTISFRVDNLGNLATAAVTWVDRVVLSTDKVYGNADDLELAVFNRSGPLNATSFYTVASAPVTIPHGLSGNYYVIARTDHTNTVGEFVLEGDNETVSNATIAITRADYPDLVVEDLAVSAPDVNGVRTATWTLANRGTGAASLAFSERFVVRNSTTGLNVVNTLTPVPSALAPDATLPRQATIATTAAGNYTVEVTADAQSQKYEYNELGHDDAEDNNVGSTTFAITQLYTLTVQADPAEGGLVSGGGVFQAGSNRTVTAMATAPYLFVGWFEDAILRSTDPVYTSPLTADRTLTARFSYPTVIISTQVAPAGAGLVSGGGTYAQGEAVNLSATALPGYAFANWSEGETNLGSAQPFTFNASVNRTIRANFTEANPAHVVTTATSPAGIATITGAGTYNNGQTAVITAPATVSTDDTEYVFSRFLLNGAPAGTTTSLSRTFTTLDPATFAYVAEYISQGVKPSVAQVTTNVGNRVGLTSNFRLTLRFDRAMNTAIKPLVQLVSENASSVPAVPLNGAWTTADTYVAPAITVDANHGGDYTVAVSAAQDTQGRVMNAVELFPFTIDVTAPVLPSLTQSASTASTATVEWLGYVAPSDLASFRVYRSASAFTSLAGLSPVGSLSAGARDHTFSGLSVDTDYHVAIVPVDSVGNAQTDVASFVVRIGSAVPPAVDFEVVAASTTSARVTWTFNAEGSIGFKGFKIYRHSASFTSIEGMTPHATLGQNARSFEDLGLDRAATLFYTVVAYNNLDQSVTSVVSKPWKDPLSDTLTEDFTVTEPLLVISKPLTIAEGATFTIPAGTVIAFAPEAGITVQSGRIVANGTVYAPVVFTSIADVEDTNPVRGSWNGIALADAEHASLLHHVWVKYGMGLAITAGSHDISSFGAAWNELAGLQLAGSVTLTTDAVYLANNAIGASVEDGAALTLTGSVLKNNGKNAAIVNTGTLNAAQNWWGTTDASAIAASLVGPVVATSPLTQEPLLTAGLRSVDGATSTGLSNLPMLFASVNATAYRVSEDSSFAGVLFVDVPRDPLSPDLFNTAAWEVSVPLSAGAGSKTLHAQFRSPTGAVSETVSFSVDYVTDGPVIGTFSLSEGQTVNRPVLVTATATSALPITSMTLFVDDAAIASSNTGALEARWDIRSLNPGVHRVRLAVLDAAERLASRTLNIVVNPLPPARPEITSPVSETSVVVNQITVSGTAEPLADLRIQRNGTVVATVAADAAGAFTAANISLVEGTNELTALAFDEIGSTASTSVFVSVDSGAPAPVTLLPIEPNGDEGVFVDWDLPTVGEVPVAFRVYWHNAPFASVSEATGQTEKLLSTFTKLNALEDGVHYFAVVGYDNAGNASAMSNLRSYSVDLTAPSFTIAFDQAMPIGPGPLGITVTASEPLKAAPVLLIRLADQSVLSVKLTAAGGNSYSASFPVTTLSARSGIAGIIVTGTDLAGNTFTGAPAGPGLVFDVTKPTGALTTSVSSPVQTKQNVALTVSLTLSELPKLGTTPTLSFSPPEGSALPLTLTGNGLNWVAQLTVTPAMGNGNGTFLLNVQDTVGNAGTVLTQGEHLELYNTEAPTPTDAPGNFTVLPLKDGVIRLKWTAAKDAHSYRVYRDAGAGAAVPTTLVTEGITALTIDDLPPADGPYRYVVRAFRLGAESGPSGIRATTSDRTAPPAPTATSVELGATGINLSWTPAEGEAPAKWVVYRNGAAIATINNPAATTFTDAPPRGVMNYRVAASDTLGNEAQGPVATIELQVGAVSGLVATIDPEIGTTLAWTSTDATAVGFNVYRNQTKQNGALLTQAFFTDTFNAAGKPVSYRVTAVNAAGQESAGRTVLVQPLTALIRLNPAEDGDLLSVTRYFDTYRIAYTVGAEASADLLLEEGEIIRAVAGELPVEVFFPLPETTAPGESKTVDAVVPAPNIAGAVQGVSITLASAPDAGGSVVQYRFVQDFEAAQAAGLMMSVTADTPPLAGGVTDFTVRVFNRGHAAADLVLSRAGNTQPGDLEMLVTSEQGVLLSSTPFSGSVPGTIINGRGDAFLRVESGASVDIPFSQVLVPESAGGQTLTFRARFNTIYHAVGSDLERANGPLEGAMGSSAAATPYYATANTTLPAYSDDQPVVIFGKALDRQTNQPVANVQVRIGLRVRGAVIYADVFTDETGSYRHEYIPTLGLAGEIAIWAAHPDIVDQLNQVTVSFYRLFTKPGRLEAVMSKNDKLDFDVTLVNPGDLTLTNPTVSFRAYRVQDGVETTIPGVTGSARVALPTTVAPRSEPKVSLRLQAALDVPDDALFEFILATAEGATTKLTGTLSFRPALAVLTAVSPTTGYAEAGVGRGQLKSVEVTVQNRGLRDLTGVQLLPPANVPWIQVNATPDTAGKYSMADIPVGGTRSFSVVFAPPADTPVGFYNDFLVIKGDNSTGDYRLNLFATVTSEQKGSVHFDVTNTFSNPVPNTSVWLRNTTLGTEVGPLLTDANGQVLVSDLMEGDWQWKTQAAGHGATQGMVTVVPEQTVGVETELTVGMVTVKFSVVPVPFTDYYEIKIEQTFQTRTPIPNLVMSPPHQTLSVEAGWSGTLMYTLRNEGMRSMFDVKLTGGDMPTMRATPMVSFIPEIKAQQSIEIPVFFEYFGPAEAQGGASLASTARALADGSADAKSLSSPTIMAAARSSSGTATRALGPIDDILDCYEEFKYGTITFKAEGGISSVSGKPYTVGANATIDVDELLALFCDGECPGSVGGGIVGAVCGKLVEKVVEQVSKKTKVIDLVCKASNIIKAIACAAAQLPSGHVQAPPPPPPSSGQGGGTLGSMNGFRDRWVLVGSGCFLAGTPVTMADGSTLPIEQVAQGARLLSDTSGRADTVAQVMFLSSDHVREITFRSRDNAEAAPTSLRLTHEHRVWVDGRGWVFAVEVQAGDWLHGADGRLYEVTSNDRLPGRHDVYGLHMDSDNVIYAAGVLTEDQCFKDTPQFRVSPQTGGAR